MIPFGLFQAYLKSDKASIEVRALEMSPDTFTIRLADVHQAMLPAITSIQVRFYSPVSNSSVSFDLASFQIFPDLTEIEKSEPEIQLQDSSMEDNRLPSDDSHALQKYNKGIRHKDNMLPADVSHYCRTYQIKTTDPKYSNEARRLTDEYLTYIRHRTSMFPEELSHTYYPAYPQDQEDVFFPDWKSQREALGHGIMMELAETKNTPVTEGASEGATESAMEGTSEGATESAMEGASDGVTESAMEGGLEGAVVDVPSGADVTAGADVLCTSGEYGIVIKYESQIKEFLTMNPAAFLKVVLAQSGLEGHPLCSRKLTHVYFGDACCPLLFPQPEQYESILIHCKKHGLRPVFQLAPVSESLVSDICENLLFLNEILLQQNCRAELEAGDAGILEYCKELDGFERVSKGILMCKKKKDPRMGYLTEGASIKNGQRNHDNIPLLDETEDAIYLPYYQTNTGTFCPLRAMVEQGNRSKQTRIRTCHQICQEKRILYPSHLSLVGIGNTLFGFNSNSLIEGYKEIKKRIVINL